MTMRTFFVSSPHLRDARGCRTHTNSSECAPGRQLCKYCTKVYMGTIFERFSVTPSATAI